MPPWKRSVATRRRRVSRATREKISKALRAYHRAQARAHRIRVRAAKKAAATRAANRRAKEERRIARTQRRRQREAERAREQFGDFEDYEIEIAVDYVPAGRRS